MSSWRLLASTLALVAGGCVAPRTAHAQSQNYLTIARHYQPTLYVNKDDRFWPASFLNVLSLTWDGRYTCLVTPASAAKTCGSQGRPLSVGLLPPGRGSKSDYLDYPAGKGDISDQAKSFQQNAGPPASSARVYFYAGSGRRSTGTIASFQYWYFYNFNYIPVSVVARGYHEADLEHVSILFSEKRTRLPDGRPWSYKAPKYVFFSQHSGGELVKWRSSSLQRNGNSPVAYAAKGSHANYKDCGTHHRVGPRDISDCDKSELHNFRRAPLIPIQNASWACWNGKLGNGGGTFPRYSGAPRAPLQQQKFFDGTPRDICSRFAGASAAAGAPAATRLFDDCGDWERPPASRGTKLVVCDEGILDRFFASGLSNPGSERLRLEAPGERSDPDPPGFMASADPGALGRARIAAERPVSPAVYAAERRADGTLVAARFPAVAVEPGAVLRLVRRQREWRIAEDRGRVLAVRAPRVTRVPQPPPRPVGVSIRRGGRSALVSWRAASRRLRDVTFYVTAAGGARQVRTASRILGRVRASGRATYQAIVPLHAARYLEVVAYRRGRERGSGARRVPAARR